MAIKSWMSLLEQTFQNWNDHQTTRLSAAVAFYSLLSIAPLLIFVTALVTVVVSKQAAQTNLIHEANQLMGSRGGDFVRGLLKNVHKQSSGGFATTVAFITLLFGASGVFCELRDAMNTIWDAQSKFAKSWRGMVMQRLFSFGMVLSVGFLLLVSLILSTALAFIGTFFASVVPFPPALLETFNFLLSFAVITFLFALIFKFVPAVKVPWEDVVVGSVGTALLFTIGKFLLGLYLGKTSIGSTYGAAGSVVALIVWVYYSAQIFFFGAEFTRVYSDARIRREREARERPRASETTPKTFRASA
ncbi:MAG TPA: YihY/virulence factor BrkB family protein [Bryobacteraceae bacterium]|nr:YihY/virulence factor BrkB family protein [Bryobacteraceae bacterium]